jgi:NTP pyrophosphatase (non-canonical NTP hydrolase)
MMPTRIECPYHPQSHDWITEIGTRCAVCGFVRDLTEKGSAALHAGELVTDPLGARCISVEVRSLDRYQQLADVTSSHGGEVVVHGEHQHPYRVRERISMACMGLAGEAGEFVDLLKKVLYHGHALDIDKAKKELGDVAWYVNEAASALGLAMSDVASANVAKLRARYGEKFSIAASIARVDVAPAVTP